MENAQKITGEQAARMVLESYGISDIQVACYNDHIIYNLRAKHPIMKVIMSEENDKTSRIYEYDFSTDTVYLAEEVFHGTSVYAMCIGIIAGGSAIQQAMGSTARKICIGVAKFLFICLLIVTVIGIWFRRIRFTRTISYVVKLRLSSLGIVIPLATVLYMVVFVRMVAFSASKRGFKEFMKTHQILNSEYADIKKCIKEATLECIYKRGMIGLFM